MTYPELSAIQFFPDECQKVADPFEFKQEEEQRVVLVHTLLANYTIEWVLCFILEADVVADL